MSRYEGHYDYEMRAACMLLAICVVLMFLVMLGVNACSATEWNDGYCPDCNVKYELCAAYEGLRYYACPECGNEVERYGGR